MKKYAFVFLILFAGKVYGGEPVPVKAGPVPPVVSVTGNEQPYDIGDTVILSANVDKSKSEGISSITYRWIIVDGDKAKKALTTNGGAQIGFGTGRRARKITVVLDVTCLFLSKDERGTIKEASVVAPDPVYSYVEITDSNPPTPVPPTPTPVPPTPNPTPVPPTPSPQEPSDGPFGLAPFTYKLLQTSVPETDRKAADWLGNSFNATAAQLAAGTVNKNDTKSILTALKASNLQAVTNGGSSKDKWQQFDKLLGDRLYELYSKNELKNGDDWISALNEVARGLKFQPK